MVMTSIGIVLLAIFGLVSRRRRFDTRDAAGRGRVAGREGLFEHFVDVPFRVTRAGAFLIL
ncbi:hypothetical protein WS67_08350 [Burkholderia singularis]|uniref:Uncharacterized protein n=2 Tax=Burkholderia singularis TaxID=1503053 RepID=A0A124P9J6_9BURK|nr:hypothetical protein WS67_08350 [Burkholderia singularis]